MAIHLLFINLFGFCIYFSPTLGFLFMALFWESEIRNSIPFHRRIWWIGFWFPLYLALRTPCFLLRFVITEASPQPMTRAGHQGVMVPAGLARKRHPFSGYLHLFSKFRFTHLCNYYFRQCFLINPVYFREQRTCYIIFVMVLALWIPYWSSTIGILNTDA